MMKKDPFQTKLLPEEAEIEEHIENAKPLKSKTKLIKELVRAAKSHSKNAQPHPGSQTPPLPVDDGTK